MCNFSSHQNVICNPFPLLWCFEVSSSRWQVTVSKAAEAMVNLQSKHSWIVPQVSQWTCSLAEMGSKMRSEGCDKTRNMMCYQKDESTWKMGKLTVMTTLPGLGTTKIDWSERVGLQNCLRIFVPKSSISLVLPLRSIPSMLRNQMLWICFQAALDPEREKQWNYV